MEQNDSVSTLAGYKYQFKIGAMKAGFKIVSGANRVGKIPSGRLTFEDGIGQNNPFYGFYGTLEGKHVTMPCRITVIDEYGSITRIFGFDCGIITCWDCFSRNKNGSELMINKIEIIHTGLYEIE